MAYKTKGHSFFTEAGDEVFALYSPLAGLALRIILQPSSYLLILTVGKYRGCSYFLLRGSVEHLGGGSMASRKHHDVLTSPDGT